ncbi:MAG: hypothetical protein PUE79_03555 [Bacteroidales bacterium]|nr:hypothetical protein [Bacteroidales bacterium]
MRRQNGVSFFSIADLFSQNGVWENAIWSKGCELSYAKGFNAQPTIETFNLNISYRIFNF